MVLLDKFLQFHSLIVLDEERDLRLVIRAFQVDLRVNQHVPIVAISVLVVVLVVMLSQNEGKQVRVISEEI